MVFNEIQFYVKSNTWIQKELSNGKMRHITNFQIFLNHFVASQFSKKFTYLCLSLYLHTDTRFQVCSVRIMAVATEPLVDL